MKSIKIKYIIILLIIYYSSTVRSDGLDDPLFKPLTAEYVLHSFELIALRNEYSPSRHFPLRKWNKPVRIFMDSRAGDSKIQSMLLEENIKLLSEITQLDIKTINAKKKANVFVVFELDRRMKKVVGEYVNRPEKLYSILEEGVCTAHFQVNRRSQIIRAVIFIPPDKARRFAKLPACVLEELTQILGLPNDSDEVFPSIFNDSSIDDELSTLDVVLLKILYDKRLTAGLLRDKVIPIASRIFQELKQACQKASTRQFPKKKQICYLIR